MIVDSSDRMTTENTHDHAAGPGARVGGWVGGWVLAGRAGKRVAAEGHEPGFVRDI
jgi:hypothetical protein